LWAVRRVEWLYFDISRERREQGRGQTGAGIVREDGGRGISFGRASGRFFAKMISG